MLTVVFMRLRHKSRCGQQRDLDQHDNLSPVNVDVALAFFVPPLDNLRRHNAQCERQNRQEIFGCPQPVALGNIRAE